jgi:hypothetical protein
VFEGKGRGDSGSRELCIYGGGYGGSGELGCVEYGWCPDCDGARTLSGAVDTPCCLPCSLVHLTHTHHNIPSTQT